MLKGCLKSTGGYKGKYGDIETVKSKVKTWEEVKEENKFNKKIISSQRILYVEKDGIQGKKCCRCKEWHIDHIKPCNSFNLVDLEEQKICLHYTNFKTLWKLDNLAKGSKV